MSRFFVIFISILALSFSINYFFILQQKKNLIEVNAQKIDSILSENFEETEKILVFLGRKIAEETPNLDLKTIHKIFAQSSAIKGSDNVFSWSLFDWVDAESYQIVNTMLGVRKNPPQMLERNYNNRANETWKLIFSKTVTGNPSGILVIPVGVQIETKNSRHAGTVAVGFSIKKLTNIIESRLDKNIHFAIIDKTDNKFSFGSFEAKKNFDDIYFKRLDLVDPSKLIFSLDLEQKYPYKIVTRFDVEEFWREVFYSSLLLFAQIMAVVVAIRFWKK